MTCCCWPTTLSLIDDMVIRILERAKSCKSAYDYNAKKCFEGKAVVAGFSNFERGDLYTIKKTFQRYEDNIRISDRVKKKGFHMAVNPGVDDKISDVETICFIYDLMDEMGYAQQPYVIFRHNDIEREHFHVVSVNVREDGSVMSSSFIAQKFLAAARNMSEGRGFKIGLSEEEKQKKKESVRRRTSLFMPASGMKYRFNPSAGVREGLVRAYEEALGYDFRSFYQFACAMNAMGVLVSRAPRKDGGYNLVMKGLDAEDRTATLFFSAENDLGFNGYARMMERVEENRMARPFPKRYADVRAQVVGEWCKEISESSDMFRKFMRVCGLEVYISRNEDMTMHRVTISDPRDKRVIEAEDLGPALSIESFRDEESSKRWRKPRKRGMEKGEVRVSKADKEELRRRIIERCEAEGVAIPEKIRGGSRIRM